MLLNNLKNVVIIFGLVLLSKNSYGITCEEDNALRVASAAAACGPNSCDGNGWCVTWHGLYYYTIPIPVGTIGFGCSYTVSDNNGSITRHDNLSLITNCNLDGPISETKSAQSAHSTKACGSVVEIESQTLGESIPLVGSSFGLYYYSGYQAGRVGGYKIEAVLAGAVPKDYITDYNVRVYRGATLVDSQSYSNVPNQKYTFIWDGLDLTSNPSLGPEKFKIEVERITPTVSYTIPEEYMLGSYNAKTLGLGGFLPDNYAFYSVVGGQFYHAQGFTEKRESFILSGTQLGVVYKDLVYVFDSSSGILLKIKSKLLGVDKFVFNYSPSGLLTSIVEPFSKVTTFNRDSSGNLLSIEAPNGVLTDVVLNTAGYLESVTNANSEVFEMTYQTGGLLSSFKKPSNKISSFVYDLEGNLARDEHSGGYFFELAKNIGSYKDDVTKTTKMGRTTRSYGYGDTKSYEKYVTHSNGQQEYHKLSHETDYSSQQNTIGPIEKVLRIEIDPRFGKADRYVKTESVRHTNTGITHVKDTTTDVTLSDVSDPFSILTLQYVNQFNYSSNVVTTDYDPVLKSFTSTSTLGRTQEVRIDSYERVISNKVGSNIVTSFGYSDDLLTSIAQGTRTTTFTYDPVSRNLASLTNSEGETTAYGYDLAGRVTSEVLPDLRVISYSYDADGQLSGVTPPGRPLHEFITNSSGLPGSYVSPSLLGVSNTATVYSYNDDKQLTSVVRPNGSAISFVYGSDGKLQGINTPSGSMMVSIDNQTQNISSIRSLDDYDVSLIYDGENVRDNSTWTPSYGSYYYDQNRSGYGGRVESDRAAGSIGFSPSISFTYNNDDQLLTAGSMSLSYSYPNGTLTSSTIGTTPAIVSDQYVYNNFGEVEEYSAYYGSTLIYKYELGRSTGGRINAKEETLNSITNSYSYGFDDVGRLDEVSKNSSVIATYGYDSNNNRNAGSVGSTTTTAVYDNQDRMNSYNLNDYTYNANGELQAKVNSLTSATTTYTYDVFGNLKSVVLPSSTTVTYHVDGLNRRVAKLVGGTFDKRWIFQDQLRIVAEMDASGAITKRFVYATKSNVPDYMIYGGENYRIISDYLGSPRLVVKVSDGTIAQRMNHDEFGRVTEDTNPGFIPFGFAGGLYDPDTGLIRFGARDYDPETGRWTSKDPILFDGGDSNLFGYVANDPINYFDPEGESSKTNKSVLMNNASGGGGGGANVAAIVKPNGQLIGTAGPRSTIRHVRGGVNEAKEMFSRLNVGGAPTCTSYKGAAYDFPGGGMVGMRTTSSRNGPPTIDIMDIPGLPNIKIKFIGD